MPGKTNILHIIDALNYGGAQQLLFFLAKYTPKSNYNVIICVLQDDEQIKDLFEQENVKVISLKKKRYSIINFFYFLRYVSSVLKRLGHICRQEDVHVIQCHLSDAEFLGILAGRLYKVDRIITTVHSSELLPQRNSFSPRNWIRIIATRVLYRWTRAIIAVSNETASNVQKVFKVPPEKIYIIPNRIDVNAYQRQKNFPLDKISPALSAEHRILCLVGRLMPPKGHTYLLQAVKILCTEYPELRLLLVGDGELRRQLEDLCLELGIQDNVLFLGSRADIADILSITEIFVLSSLWEGISLALIEAMAAGKPIVATDIPANQELLTHMQNGLLVPKQDPQALAEAIKSLLDDSVLAGKLGSKALQAAREKHDISLTIKELQPLWA